MQIIDTAIEEVKIVVPQVFGDARGYFFESWSESKYKEAGIDCCWVQDNESKSKYGVLRGLHYQAAPYTQAKLVRVIEGCVLDVTVDIRKGSSTFGKHVAVELSAENKYQLFVPRGFAHGFVVLSESVVFAYKCDNIYMPSHERGIAFNDPALGIDWKEKDTNFLLSAKDSKNPLLADAELFDYNTRDYLK
ncbi:MAG: dTDP-4-dehydrorhamnose 3,5-epimerase [Lentisphaeria bacterium]|nr:dTDP-4-dehydrorhamnose 3,5-epimerase [Lentisphaeria bacterium]